MTRPLPSYERPSTIDLALFGFCAFGLLACGTEDEMDATAHDFAVYWSESEEWCSYFDDCGIQERASCEEA